VKERGHSINLAIVYVLSRAANAIPEFRYRIRPGGVVEHETVHPATTIMAEADAFSFCYFEHNEDFLEFITRAAERVDHYRRHPTLQDEPGRDDYLFMTAIPWVSFTSFMHPTHLQPGDSVPRFAWGKFFEDGESLKMPLQVQGHHALMDGVHVGEFYGEVETMLHHPESIMGDP
jgi:chloramphenicol O-acetyltransferase type A